MPESRPGLLDDRSEEIVVRDFASTPRGSDDAACKDLERRATMIPRYLKWFVDGHTIHNFDFDYKAKMFPDSCILLADSVQCGVVGMICGAVKNVSLHWVKSGPVKALYVFDLRISVSHQKHGLGKRLLQELEKRAVQMGAQYAYLTVNSDNGKAQRLFGKMGFAECSVREPVGALSSATTEETNCVHVKHLGAEAARQVLRAELSGLDFLPGDLDRLLSSPFYLGTFTAGTAHPGGAVRADTNAPDSFASVSLWDGSALTSWCISRFFFPAEWYSRWSFLLGMSCSLVVVCSMWLKKVLGWFETGNHLKAYGGSCLTLLTAGLAAGFVAKFRPLLPLIVLMLGSQGRQQKLRARLFAPSQRGPLGMELLEATVARAKSCARDLGFKGWVCNLAADSPLRGGFGAPPNFRTFLMHKWLVDVDEPLPRCSNIDFHDPRDI